MKIFWKVAKMNASGEDLAAYFSIDFKMGSELWANQQFRIIWSEYFGREPSSPG